MKYISFKAIMNDDYIRCLHANNCKNLKGKYKILCNIDVNYLVKY